MNLNTLVCCNGKQALWWNKTIVYEIYVQTFFDSNGDGIGDLNGVASKLDYLKDLGIGCIWLSPIFETPYFDCCYDCSDFYNINPDFGTLDDFKNLLEQAHLRGIKVIIDLVLTYTSDKHPWFIEACKSRDNKYHDYYIFAEGKAGKAPNNKICFLTTESAWEYNAPTDDFFFHFWPKEQVHLNWENPEVQREMFEVARYWLEIGVDGYRLDAINALMPIKDLAGDPVDEEGKVIFWRPEYWQIHFFMKQLRRIMDQYPDGLLLGEVFPGGTAQTVEYYGKDDEFNLVFNFTYLHTIKSYCGDNFGWATLFDTAHYDAKAESMANKLRSMLKLEDSVCSAYQYWPTVVLGNHDQPRIASVLKGLCKDDVTAHKMVKWGAVYTLCLKGTPFIYNGEEIGMESWRIPQVELYMDKQGLVYYNNCLAQGYSKGKTEKILGMITRDNCRTPMQWNSDKNAGFSTADSTWLPVAPSYFQLNVAEQEANPNSTWHFYKKLAEFRNRNSALQCGNYIWVDQANPDYLAFLRESADHAVLVILSCTEKRIPIALHNERIPEGKKAELFMSSYGNGSALETGFLQPFEACIYLLE